MTTTPIVTEPVKGIRKKELYFTILKDFQTNQVRRETLEVIMELRECSKKEAQDVKTLRLCEVEEIKKRFE